MRLAQAARKLSITTEDIVDFLKIRGISIEKDSNTKLEEEAVNLLYRYFEIEEDTEIEQPEVEEEVAVNEEVAVKEESNEDKEEKEDTESLEIVEGEKKETDSYIEEELKAQPEPDENQVEGESKARSFKTVEELLESQEEETDENLVIKPAKVELKGLNVLGKIDLPEPKSKPLPEKKEETKVKVSKKSYGKSKDHKSSRRRPQRELSPTELRKREEQREAKKREKAEREKKKKREQFYKEKILKPKQLEQKSKPKKKVYTEEKVTMTKPKPKTALGKFWRWLNT